tara:strand:+ start:316 stop:1068 length:753 start_codon:yes stop_codon:yes gene_type:complete
LSNNKKTRRGLFGFIVGAVFGYFLGTGAVANLLRDQGIRVTVDEQQTKETVTVTERAGGVNTITVTEGQTTQQKQGTTGQSSKDWKNKFKEIFHKYGLIDQAKVTDLPKPWLSIDYTWNSIKQLTNSPSWPPGPNQPIELSFDVSNMGSFPAITCYIDVLEGPPLGEQAPLSEYELRDRKIMTLQPGTQKTIKFNNIYLKNQSGLLVGIVHDPLLDPKGWYIDGPISFHNRHLHHASFDKASSIAEFKKV